MHGRHHGGAWKVAYADFVTAMMALFIVLWINGQSSLIKAHVSEYFIDPIGYNQKVKTGSSPVKLNDENAAETKGKLDDEKALFAKLAERIKKDLNNKIQIDKLKNQITIEIVKEGLRIELLESRDAFFFDIGTAKLKPGDFRGAGTGMVRSSGANESQFTAPTGIRAKRRGAGFHGHGTPITSCAVPGQVAHSRSARRFSGRRRSWSS